MVSLVVIVVSWAPASEIAKSLLVQPIAEELGSGARQSQAPRSSTGWAPRRTLSCMSCSTRWRSGFGRQGVTIERSLVGSYLTALDMAGVLLDAAAPSTTSSSVCGMPR